MMYATTKVMPEAFPYAEVILLCDNKNLSSLADSADKRIVRWQQEVRDSGAIRRRWVPGNYNTIADYGSRTVVPDLEYKMSEEEKFEMYIYSMVSSTGSPPLLGKEEGLAVTPEASTVVPGHHNMAPMTAKIAVAQAAAPDDEKESWASKPKYSQVTLAGQTLHLLNGLLIVPRAASDIKRILFQIAHDNDCHYSGSGRTVQNLKTQAKVVWVGMDDEVKAYIGSCFKCQFAKSGLARTRMWERCLQRSHRPYTIRGTRTSRVRCRKIQAIFWQWSKDFPRWSSCDTSRRRSLRILPRNSRKSSRCLVQRR